MDQIKLRPCPFCGSEAVVTTTLFDHGYVAKCHGLECHVAPQTDMFNTAEEAAACWNGPEEGEPVGLIDPLNENKGRLIVDGKIYDVILSSHTSDYKHVCFGKSARTIELHRFVFESRTFPK